MQRTPRFALGMLLALACPALLTAQTCVKEATRCITAPSGGDCASIGLWNGQTRTCSLTKDLAGESIEIAGDGITLDGKGRTLTGGSIGELLQPFAVLVAQQRDVTVTNLTIRGFQIGIGLSESSHCVVTASTLSDTSRSGIEMNESNDNRIAGNHASGGADGIVVNLSTGNVLEKNTVESNHNSGILLNNGASRNVLKGNVARRNSGGITLGGDSDYNTLTGNEVAENTNLGLAIYFYSNENAVLDNRIAGNAAGVENGAGILVMQSSGNRFTNNTVSGNSRGIWISYPDTALYDGGGNEVYNNNFLANRMQALVTGRRSLADAFSKQAPIGGNFWDNWKSPDAGGDGIVDAAYRFGGSGDELPWSAQDGWAARPAAPASPDIVQSSPAHP